GIIEPLQPLLLWLKTSDTFNVAHRCLGSRGSLYHSLGVLMEYLYNVLLFLAQIVFFWIILSGKVSIDRSWLVVQYGWVLKVVVIVFTLFFSLVLYSAIQEERVIQVVYWFLFSIVGVGLVSLNEVFRRKIWFDEKMIYYQSAFGKRVRLPLSEVVSISRGRYGSSFKIVGAKGQKVECFLHMAGSIEFYNYVRSISRNDQT
ncbi:MULTISPECIES: DUF6560 family protein, partial [unclassified Marinobacter]